MLPGDRKEAPGNMTTMHIVVHDPKNEYWEGALVNQEYATVLNARGVTLLPVEPKLLTASAFAGYFKRSWGAGWPLDSGTPKMNCPLALYAFKDLRTINWCARVLPMTPADMKRAIDGQMPGGLRFTGDSGQLGGFSGGINNTNTSNIEARRLGRPDEDGGWTLSGSALLQVQTEGIFTCALYGHAPGLRVAWAAVSQTA